MMCFSKTTNAVMIRHGLGYVMRSVGPDKEETWLGDYDAALTHMQEALEVAQAAQHTLRICEASLDMVYVYLAQEALEQAHDQLCEALNIVKDIGTPHFLAKMLAAAISLWQAQGEIKQAAIWAGLLIQHTQLLHPSLFDMAIFQQLETALGPQRYREALEQGKALILENILSEIMSGMN